MEVVPCLFFTPMLVAHQVIQALTNVIQGSHPLVEVTIMPVWCVEVRNGKIYYYWEVKHWTVGCEVMYGLTHAGVCEADEISLFSGTALHNSTSGIVQTCVLGVRGVICDSNWDHIDAKVVCQQLGYSPYGNYQCALNGSHK